MEDRNEPYPSDDVEEAISTLEKLIEGKSEYDYYTKQINSVDMGFVKVTLLILQDLE